MNRRKFVHQLGWISAGLFLSPSLALGKGHFSFRKIPVASQIQVRHGLFSLADNAGLSKIWWETIQHNRFLANGHTPQEIDLLSYSFQHQLDNYQLLCKGNQCHLYTPDMEDSVLLNASDPVWKNKSFQFTWIAANTSVTLQQDTFLLPLQQAVYLNNQAVVEGEIVHWKSFNKEIQFKYPIISIK